VRFVKIRLFRYDENAPAFQKRLLPFSFSAVTLEQTAGAFFTDIKVEAALANKN
jgi:hypothetical protein